MQSCCDTAQEVNEARVLEIVERHHGRIYYENSQSGGNVFSFTVPVCEESHEG